MSRIIAVSNQKGGVGKTTTSICLGSSLVKLDKKVLIIDLDPQGNCSIALGLDMDKISKTVLNALMDENDVNRIIKKTLMQNLDIIPSNVALTRFAEDNINSETDESAYILKTVLGKVKKNYDYIIIDCPPSLMFLFTNAMAAANSVLIPIQPEPFAMDGITKLLVNIKKMQVEYNPNLQIEGFLVTMFEEGDKINNDLLQEIRSTLKQQVFDTIIPRNGSIPESQAKGIPAILFRPTSVGSVAYLNLAKELLNRERNLI